MLPLPGRLLFRMGVSRGMPEIVSQYYNIPGQNWLQAIFGIIGKVILFRIIVQVPPLIPAWSKKL